MPDKEGSEDEKTTKGVVKKKTKQMLNQEYIPEEEYDHYRDQILMRGGDHRSKETRERSNTSTGKQPKGDTVYQAKLRKKHGGKIPSALDLVKADITKKYGKGAIMNVGKKKANEELDLTKVAEAFGGYVIENIKDPKFSNPKIEKKFQNSPEAKRLAGQERGAKKLAKAAGINVSGGKEQSAAAQAFRDMKLDKDKKFSDLTPDVKTGMRSVAAGKGKAEPVRKRGRRAERVPDASGGKKTGSLRKGNLEFPGDRTGATQQAKSDIDQKELLKKAGASGDIGFTAPDRKAKVKKRTDRADAQGTPDPFSVDTSKAAQQNVAAFGDKPVTTGIEDPVIPKKKGISFKDFRGARQKAIDNIRSSDRRLYDAGVGKKPSLVQQRKFAKDKFRSFSKMNPDQRAKMFGTAGIQGDSDTGAGAGGASGNIGDYGRVTIAPGGKGKDKGEPQKGRPIERPAVSGEFRGVGTGRRDVVPTSPNRETNKRAATTLDQEKLTQAQTGVKSDGTYMTKDERRAAFAQSKGVENVKKNLTRGEMPSGFKKTPSGNVAYKPPSTDSPNVSTGREMSIGDINKAKLRKKAGEFGRAAASFMAKTQDAQRKGMGAAMGLLTKTAIPQSAGAEAGLRYARGEKGGALLSAIQSTGGPIGFAAGVINAYKSMNPTAFQRTPKPNTKVTDIVKAPTPRGGALTRQDAERQAAMAGAGMVASDMFNRIKNRRGKGGFRGLEGGRTGRRSAKQ